MLLVAPSSEQTSKKKDPTIFFVVAKSILQPEASTFTLSRFFLLSLLLQLNISTT